MNKVIDTALLKRLGFIDKKEYGYFRLPIPKFDVDPRKFDPDWIHHRSYYPTSQLLTLAIL